MSMGPLAGLSPYCLVLQHSAWRRKCLELWNRLKSRNENNRILCQYWTNAFGLDAWAVLCCLWIWVQTPLFQKGSHRREVEPVWKQLTLQGLITASVNPRLLSEASCHPGACGHVVMVTGEQLRVGSRFPSSSREETLPVLLPVLLEILRITTRRFYGSILSSRCLNNAQGRTNKTKTTLAERNKKDSCFRVAA